MPEPISDPTAHLNDQLLLLRLKRVDKGVKREEGKKVGGYIVNHVNPIRLHG